MRGLLEGETRFVPKSSVHSDAPTSFPNRGTTCISESGLYRLIIRSEKPDARAFRDWKAREVLPAIRSDLATARVGGAGSKARNEAPIGNMHNQP